ncbi:hypothetical protein PG990_004708 [Apiospora arundinis]
MPPLPRGGAMTRLEQVRLATGDPEKSSFLPALVSWGQSRSIEALDGKLKQTDSDVQSFGVSLQELRDAFDKAVSLVTKRQDDAVSKMDELGSRLAESEKRYGVLAEAEDNHCLAISRELEHCKTRLDGCCSAQEATGVAYQKDIAQFKLELQENNEALRNDLALLAKQYQEARDAEHVSRAGIASSGLYHLAPEPTNPRSSRESKAIRRFRKDKDRYQRAMERGTPVNEENFMWGLIGLLHPMVAEFVQHILLKRCPQYVKKRVKACRPSETGVEPIIYLYGETGKRLPRAMFFSALEDLDVGVLNTELLRLENGEN